MTTHYSDEKNVQIIIALLKYHGIKKVVASPGATNVTLVVSMQRDSYFEVYSSVDERSAAYLACGLAAESGEPVVISCTGATASRNYLPGLTEAYYRKLPVLAITSTQKVSRVGHLHAQVIDRASIQNDVATLSLTLPIVRDDEDWWECEVKVNQAILALKRHGGGPVHINLPTTYNQSYTTIELPSVRKIDRITPWDKFPELHGKIGVFIGSHNNWTKEEENILDTFCSVNDAVVFCDHTSGYKGKYRVLYSLAGCQQSFDPSLAPDIIINIGEVSGDYYNMGIKGKQIWRVSPDGEVRDTYRKLRYIFEMPEMIFFEYYSKNTNEHKDTYLQACKSKLNELYNKIPELPFSNIWLASKIAHQIPEGSVVHFGILNSLRSWNFFELPDSVQSASNVGGFGIDGGVSSLIGASLANKSKLYFGVIGDLAFFYDMNVIGNRHVGNNIRILLVNNGKGTEFRQYKHHASILGDEADEFVAAAGHFGNKSQELVKNYVTSLGFEYLSASDKQQFDKESERFLSHKIGGKPIIFEVFTNSSEESDALKLIMSIEQSVKDKTKESLKQLIGEDKLRGIKRILGR